MFINSEYSAVKNLSNSENNPDWDVSFKYSETKPFAICKKVIWVYFEYNVI